MIPVYICDDESAVCRTIAEIVEKQIMIHALDAGPVRIFENPEALIERQQENTVPAIYFLDIDFVGSSINGFELAAQLRKQDPRGFMIFITAHDDLAFETFRYRLEAMDYIVKGEYSKMQERIQSCMVSIEERLKDEPAHGAAYFTLKLFDMTRHIPLKDIIYLEAIGRRHVIRIHLMDEIIDFNSSLGKLEGELGGQFWRCHRGFLVNREHIKGVDLKANVVNLDSGVDCLLSRQEKAKYKMEIS